MKRAVRVAGLLLLALTVALWACDSGPSGPGAFEATVQPPDQVSAGAALVTVSGEGVRGIAAAGNTRLFTSGPDQDGGYRVLLVNTGSGRDLRFRVEVRDVGEAPPSATVLELADDANEPLLSVSGARVRFDL